MGICGSKGGGGGGESGGGAPALQEKRQAAAARAQAAAADALPTKAPPNDASKLTREQKVELMKMTNVAGLENEVVVRKPGDVAGWDMNIDGCKGCTIAIFDRIAALNGDECEDCKLVIGPCCSSVFLRDCKNCTIVVACQQFRTRKLENCTVLIYSQTRPIVESSRGLKFGCYPLSYPQLPEQMALAGLSPLCNPWSAVHDFTPSPLSYSVLTEAEQDAAAAEICALPACAEVGADFGAPCVPLSLGSRSGRPPVTMHAVLLLSTIGTAALARKLSELPGTLVRTDVLPGTKQLLNALKTAAMPPPALAKAAQAGATLVSVEAAGQSAATLRAALEAVQGGETAAVFEATGISPDFLFPSYLDQGGQLK